MLAGQSIYSAPYGEAEAVIAVHGGGPQVCRIHEANGEILCILCYALLCSGRTQAS